MHDSACDVLILGSGVAALATALAAAPRTVCIVTPGVLARDGASSWAQGGIAAAIGIDDAPRLHADDTFAAGAGHGQRDLIDLLCESAPTTIDWLRELGCQFDADVDAGVPSLGREAAHGRARIVHASGDATGVELMRALREAVLRAPHIHVAEGWRARRLLQDAHGGVTGALCESTTAVAPMRALRARHTVLATGGIGNLFRFSTNPPHADGSGIAMALRAGAAMRDLEFVQFHPTALETSAFGGAALPLLTEALRGAGAILFDEAGQRFMAAIPGGELAARDVVARAVSRARRRGKVFLDVPVVAAVHYHMGGIAVDRQSATSLPGLHAVGEVAGSGVHGANRLASNSLLEGLVWGRALGLRLAHTSSSGLLADAALPSIPAEPAQSDAIRQRLRNLLWEGAGVERDGPGMRRSLAAVESIASGIAPGTRCADAADVAAALLRAALCRPSSLGAHHRSDDPATVMDQALPPI
jgi:L-aspartate oxidase